ncbi:MAG: hypothetical protein LBE21_00590 [Pseudomonadales bacterium]|jgi:hypothetical protein|nr:hypothetical protein [Pseudomonadales bacterium]
MSAVIRAYGANFDVDAFLPSCALPVSAAKRRGELVSPKTQANGRRHERSGIHIIASDAGFEEFPRQVTEATAFLRAHAASLRQLLDFPGVESVTLDFGIEAPSAFARSNYLPPELVNLAAALGLGLEISCYAACQSPDP